MVTRRNIREATAYEHRENANAKAVIQSLDSEDLFSLISSPNFTLAVSMGLIDGFSSIDKFGKNADVDSGDTPTTVAEFAEDGFLYKFGNDSGDDLYISSSNNDDTQEIEVQIWEADVLGNWDKKNVFVTLQGQTPVLVASNVVRCHRMQNNADFGDDIQGDVWAYYDNTDVSNGVPNDVENNALSRISNGSNQTKQLTYTIPTGYVGFLFRGESGVTRSSGTDECDFAYRSRRFGKVFKEKKDYGVMTTGNSHYSDVRMFPDPIPAKTDFDITVSNVSANNMGAWATADILLVEEDKLSDEFLTAIGQIRRVE